MQPPGLRHPGDNSDWNKQIFDSTGLHTWNDGEVGRGDANSFKSWRRLQTSREVTQYRRWECCCGREQPAGSERTSYAWVICSSCRSGPPPHHERRLLSAMMEVSGWAASLRLYWSLRGKVPSLVRSGAFSILETPTCDLLLSSQQSCSCMKPPAGIGNVSSYWISIGFLWWLLNNTVKTVFNHNRASSLQTAGFL